MKLIEDEISNEYGQPVIEWFMFLLWHVRHIRSRNYVDNGLTITASNSCAIFLASVLDEIVSALAVDRLDMICLVYPFACPSN